MSDRLHEERPRPCQLGKSDLAESVGKEQSDRASREGAIKEISSKQGKSGRTVNIWDSCTARRRLYEARAYCLGEEKLCV